MRMQPESIWLMERILTVTSSGTIWRVVSIYQKGSKDTCELREGRNMNMCRKKNDKRRTDATGERSQVGPLSEEKPGPCLRPHLLQMSSPNCEPGRGWIFFLSTIQHHIIL